MKRMQVGLIVNPIAGMGGRVGLKGTDGCETLEEAVRRGAKPAAPALVEQALQELLCLRERLLILTASGTMGESLCRSLGFECEVVFDTHKNGFDTTVQDTKMTAMKIADKNTELILFAGGDGTARDLCDVFGQGPLVVGIPTGVKIHSPVYANTPSQAGLLARDFLERHQLPARLEEVVDLDEDALRQGKVYTSLHGYLRVPFHREYLQNKKAPTPLTDKEAQGAIALYIIDRMEKDITYLIGPGTSTQAILEGLGEKGTLVGVDVVQNGKVIQRDCTEKDLMRVVVSGKTKLVLTPTGGQGFLLGRGNQQISPEVLRLVGKENIIVLATDDKLIKQQGRPLLVFTGDRKTDESLKGYFRVVTGYGSATMVPVAIG